MNDKMTWDFLIEDVTNEEYTLAGHGLMHRVQFDERLKYYHSEWKERVPMIV